MNIARWHILSVLAAALVGASTTHAQVPVGRPDAIVDLATQAGVDSVIGAWRYHEAVIRDIAFRGAGADRRPTGAPNMTYDIEPRAGAADFDDSAWEVIAPKTLADRRSTGKVCFNWYRLGLTVPSSIDGVDIAGCTAVFEITVDDYAEVWVDGELPRALGQSGGTMVAGFNVPNRLVIARDVRPGQRIQLAVFGMNGPISASPENFIWVRNARLEFHRPPYAVEPVTVATEIVRDDPALDDLIAPGTMIEKVAEGFTFGEGPAWTADGALLFSDPNENVILRWSSFDGLSEFRGQSGYQGADVARYRQPGYNGLFFDGQGRLTICEHGNRRISRLEPDGALTVLADRFEGKRLNSPNDLVYASNGRLYFTDPPFGLPQVYDDPAKELPFQGVYCLDGGRLRLVSTDLKGPNGLALSPDERYLYVANWDVEKKIVMRYRMLPDGGLDDGTVFFDMTSAPGEEALDGVEVDERGNLYVSGPGGVWIISAEGRRLGLLRGPELPANLEWGDGDRRTLYLAARTGLYRIRMKVRGARP
jgi:gluconolactonase